MCHFPLQIASLLAAASAQEGLPPHQQPWMCGLWPQPLPLPLGYLLARLHVCVDAAVPWASTLSPLHSARATLNTFPALLTPSVSSCFVCVASEGLGAGFCSWGAGAPQEFRPGMELGVRGKSKLSLESWETCARHCVGQELCALTEVSAWEQDRLGRVAGLSGVQVIQHIHGEGIGLR